jgi:arylsulfatase A-like enzyme
VKQAFLAAPVCALVALGGLAVAAATPSAQSRPSRPNIVVILSDDMGFSDVGCFGGEIQTPNLDALARNGLRFTQFYNTARCCPTRASLLTGLHPHQAGQPFLLYVAYTAAHWPMHAKEPDIAKYRGRYDAGYAAIRAARREKQERLGIVDARWTPTPLVGDWTKAKNRAFETCCMEVYAAMVDCMDHGLGRIVAELKLRKQLDHTLILYLQDNGGCAESTGRGTNATARADRVQALAAAWDAWAARADVLPLGAWRGKPTPKATTP